MNWEPEIFFVNFILLAAVWILLLHVARHWNDNQNQK